VSIGTVFFCTEHGAYDIHEGLASIFDSTDARVAQIAFQALEEDGFHPFLIPRAIAPVTNIGRLSPDPHAGPHLVLVPFHEVQAAEELLKTLELSL
jgi:hypothetical protein